MQGAGCRVQGAGCRVQGAGCRVEDHPADPGADAVRFQGFGAQGYLASPVLTRKRPTPLGPP